MCFLGAFLAGPTTRKTRKRETRNKLDIIDFDLDFIDTYVLIPSKT